MRSNSPLPVPTYEEFIASPALMRKFERWQVDVWRPERRGPTGIQSRMLDAQTGLGKFRYTKQFLGCVPK